MSDPKPTADVRDWRSIRIEFESRWRHRRSQKDEPGPMARWFHDVVQPFVESLRARLAEVEKERGYVTGLAKRQAKELKEWRGRVSSYDQGAEELIEENAALRAVVDAAYDAGWADGVRLYAVWKSGDQLVGVMQKRLQNVLAEGPPPDIKSATLSTLDKAQAPPQESQAGEGETDA